MRQGQLPHVGGGLFNGKGKGHWTLEKGGESSVFGFRWFLRSCLFSMSMVRHLRAMR